MVSDLSLQGTSFALVCWQLVTESLITVPLRRGLEVCECKYYAKLTRNRKAVTKMGVI